MNDDYLWDRSGEPDPQVQGLEETLKTLRYQPRPLVIPPDVKVSSRRVLPRTWAIAAAIGLMATVAGLWFGLRNETQPTQTSASVFDRLKIDGSATAAVTPPTVQSDKPEHDVRPATVVATNPVRRSTVTRSKVSRETFAEGKAAKDELMKALRLASSKLNLAQKKARGENAPAPSHNQHRIG